MPEPHLKSMPSVLARVRIESSESSTELMKQAEHCGLLVAGGRVTRRRRCAGSSASSARPQSGSSRSQPTLNQTGELKATFCVSSRCTSSSWKMRGVFGSGEVAAVDAPVADGLGHAADELANRSPNVSLLPFTVRRSIGRADTCWRRCWSRSSTSRSGPRHPSARRSALPLASVMEASRRSHWTSS